MKKLLSLTLAVMMLFSAMSISASASTSPSAWAVSEVKSAESAGIITNAVRLNYQKDITREEFCELVVKLYEKLTQKSASPGIDVFIDTDNQEVLKAYNLGIVKGISYNQFAPYSKITRQEICVMLVRCIGIAVNEADTNSFNNNYFADKYKIAYWAANSVNYAYDNGIIKGIGNNYIDPLGDITCEQAIMLAYRIYLKYAQYTPNGQEYTEKKDPDAENIDNKKTDDPSAENTDNKKADDAQDKVTSGSESGIQKPDTKLDTGNKYTDNGDKKSDDTQDKVTAAPGVQKPDTNTDNDKKEPDRSQGGSSSDQNIDQPAAGASNEYKNHKYAFFTKRVAYSEAERFCENLGGHLATISSAEENNYLFNLMKSKGYNSAYFGLTDSEREGVWKWVNGETVNYTNWRLGEPNAENENEDYAMFYYKYNDGTWNDGDFGGSTVNGGNVFICEWDESLNTYNGHTYMFFKDIASSYQSAERFCENAGGHLATISSAGENNYLFGLMKSKGYGGAYFGFTDSETEGKWKWVNGESINYTNWRPGEPNAENENEDYAMFYYRFTDGTWNDGDFSGSTVFICEWD